MKNLLAFLGAAAIAAVLMGTNYAGINPGASEGAIDGTLGSGFSKQNRMADSAVPIWSVRFDDGRDDLVSLAPGVATNPGDQGYRGMYWPFLVQGIPVTLCLNYEQLGQGGRATEADITRIIAEFDSAGVPIEIVNHGNSDWESGKFAWGYQDFVDEFDPAPLENAFGMPVQAFAQAGQNDAVSFARRNAFAIVDILDSLGYKFWDGAYGSLGDSLSPWVTSSPHTGEGDGSGNPLIDNQARRHHKPGRMKPGAYDLRTNSSYSIDLGVLYVERDASEAWGSSRYDDFILTETLADASTVVNAGNWDQTWKVVYSKAIANGWGHVFALHDSVSSDAAGVGDYDGQFSPHHVAWTMAQLRDAGLIRLGTMTEVLEWGHSQWAPGTNLTPNFNAGDPSFAINDTSGVHTGWAPGLGAYGSANSSFARSNNTMYFPLDAAPVYAQFDRGSSSDWPPLMYGPVVDGYRGRAGGVEWGGQANRLYAVWTELPPGRYELSFNTNNNAMAFNVLARSYAFRYARPGAAFETGFTTFGDTLIVDTYYNVEADRTITFDYQTSGEWHSISIPIEIDPVGHMGDPWSGTSVASAWDPIVTDAKGELRLWLGFSAATETISDFSFIYKGPLEY